MKKLNEFEEIIGYNFKDKSLLKESLTHSSYLNENKNKGRDNERMEFLGDAVLDIIVSEYLFKKNVNAMEGDLSFSRSILVNTSTLSTIARNLDISSYMLFSHGQQKVISPSILEGAYESIIGAIYLDGGFEVAREFVQKHLLCNAEEILAIGPLKDAKTRLQEEVQKYGLETPAYEVQNEVGPSHERQFTVKVKLGDEELAIGKGSSKKDAEKDAAEKAIKKKGW